MFLFFICAALGEQGLGFVYFSFPNTKNTQVLLDAHVTMCKYTSIYVVSVQYMQRKKKGLN